MNRMNAHWLAGILTMCLSLAGSLPASALTTEVRDVVRGVTFYSAEISSDQKTTLQMKGGLFSSSDVMTVGLSAFFFDESEAVDEYVIWMRHDGPRRWFIGQNTTPVEIHFNDGKLVPAPSHQSRVAGPDDESPFIEKLEFILDPSDFEALINSDKIEIEVQTLLGTVIKVLSAEERAAVIDFKQEVRERHDLLRDSLEQ